MITLEDLDKAKQEVDEAFDKYDQTGDKPTAEDFCLKQKQYSFMFDEYWSTFNIGGFVHHNDDVKNERMKMLIVECLGDNWFCCRYIHYKELGVKPHRKFHVSELS